MLAICKWVKADINWDIMASLKKFDRKRQGEIKLRDFYRVLEDGGIKLKAMDQKLINNDANLVNERDNVDLVCFAYLMKPNLKPGAS